MDCYFAHFPDSYTSPQGLVHLIVLQIVPKHIPAASCSVVGVFLLHFVSSGDLWAKEGTVLWIPGSFFNVKLFLFLLNKMVKLQSWELEDSTEGQH